MTDTAPRLHSERGRQRMVIAHRGASALHPENSRAAFEAAAAVADYVELDIRRTRDDHLVVFHDRTPHRTTDVRTLWPDRAGDPISSFTRAEMEQLDVGAWFGEPWRDERVLQLHEVAELLSGTGSGMFVEIKDEDAVELAAEQLHEIHHSWPGLRLAIGSIDPAITASAHRLLPALPSGVLFLDEGTIGTALQDCRDFGSFACFRNDVISPELVASAHALGWQIAHNTNTRAAVRECADSRRRHGDTADATTTDRPDIAADPDGADDIEAESLPHVVSPPGAEVVVRSSAGLGYKSSGLAHLCLIGTAGDWCDLTLDVGQDRSLTSLLLGCGPDGGTVNVELNGVTVATAVDTARSSPCRSVVRTDAHLTPGTHTVRIQLAAPVADRREATLDALELSATAPE